MAALGQDGAEDSRRRTGGYLGLFLREADGAVTIERVQPGSGAAEAGFQAGDVVAAVSGQRIIHGDQLVQALWRGRPLAIAVRRGEDTLTINTSTAALDARPRVGDPAPDFTLPARDGAGTLGLKRLLAKGRPVVLVFGSFT